MAEEEFQVKGTGFPFGSKYLFNKAGINDLSENSKNINWNNVLSMSETSSGHYAQLYCEIKTTSGTITLFAPDNRKELENFIIKNANLEFVGSMPQKRKWYQYQSQAIYRWTKKGYKYSTTSLGDIMNNSGYYGKNQKLIWIVVIIGAALLFAFYLRFLLLQ